MKTHLQRFTRIPGRNNLQVVSVALMLGLAGCSTAGTDAPHIPTLTFAQVRSSPINVARITVRNEALASEQPFVVSPQGALETYLNRRFSAQGFEGELRGVIEEAQVTQGYKPSDSKVGKFFEVAGAEEYNVVIRVRLEHADNTGLMRYSNVLTLRRVIRVSEHSSIEERERRQLEGLEILFQDLDREAGRIVLTDMKLAL